MNKNKKLYMIRRRRDGLYSLGGSYGSFSENGKIWSSLKSLNSHLSMVYGGYSSGCLTRGQDGKYSVLNVEKFADMRFNPYIDCDIVEVEMTPTVVSDVFTHIASRYDKS